MNEDVPQKLGKALCQWTPLSEKREEKMLFATDLFCSLPDPKLNALEVQLIGEKCNI